MRPARTCQTGTASATRATRQAGKDLSSHEASRDTSQPVSKSNEASRNHHGAGDAHRDLLPRKSQRRRRRSLHRRNMSSPLGSFSRLDRFHPSALAARRNGFHLSKHGPQRDGFHLSAGPRPSIFGADRNPQPVGDVEQIEQATPDDIRTRPKQDPPEIVRAGFFFL